MLNATYSARHAQHCVPGAAYLVRTHSRQACRDQHAVWCCLERSSILGALSSQRRQWQTKLNSSSCRLTLRLHQAKFVSHQLCVEPRMCWTTKFVLSQVCVGWQTKSSLCWPTRGRHLHTAVMSTALGAPHSLQYTWRGRQSKLSSRQTRFMLANL